MKVHVRCGRVTAMSKQMPADEADGENVGIVKIGRDAAPTLVRIMDRLVAAGDVRAWAPRAFAELACEQPIHAIGTRGYPWIEIDFPEDYQRAVRDVLPAIDGDPFERDETPRVHLAPPRDAARLATSTDA
jgi:choline kinase